MGFLQLLVCTLAFTTAVEAVTCYTSYSSFSCPRSYDSYDEYYCCGSGSSQYCCDYDDYDDTSVDDYYTVTYNYGAIIGGVISGIIILVIIIVISVCCCAASCPMYQSRHRGRVVQSGPVGGTVVVASSNMSTTHAQPMGQSYPTGLAPPPANYHPQHPNYAGGYQPPPSYSTQPPAPQQQGGAHPSAETYPQPPAVDAAYPPKM